MKRMLAIAILLLITQIVLFVAVSILWARFNDASLKLNSLALSVANGNQEGAKSDRAPDHVCTSRAGRGDWCESDFTRLSSYPEAAQDKRLRITGFLAVDNGVVTLFANEDDYKNMERGQSIEIKGTRPELVALVSKFGGGNVRLEGKFDVAQLEAGRGGWLGVLLPPISGQKVHPREAKEGADDIAVDVRYVDPTN